MSRKKINILNVVLLGLIILLINGVDHSTATGHNDPAGPSKAKQTNNLTTRTIIDVESIEKEAKIRWAQLFVGLFDKQAGLKLTPELVQINLRDMVNLEQRYSILDKAQEIYPLIGKRNSKIIIESRDYFTRRLIKPGSSLTETLLKTFNVQANNCSDVLLKKMLELIEALRLYPIYPILKANLIEQFKNCLVRFMRVMENAILSVGLDDLETLNDILIRSYVGPDQTTTRSSASESGNEHKDRLDKISTILSDRIHDKLENYYSKMSSDNLMNDDSPLSIISYESFFQRLYKDPCKLIVNLAVPAMYKIERILVMDSERHISLSKGQIKLINLFKMCSKIGLDKQLYRAVLDKGRQKHTPLQAQPEAQVNRPPINNRIKQMDLHPNASLATTNIIKQQKSSKSTKNFPQLNTVLRPYWLDNSAKEKESPSLSLALEQTTTTSQPNNAQPITGQLYTVPIGEAYVTPNEPAKKGPNARPAKLIRTNESQELMNETETSYKKRQDRYHQFEKLFSPIKTASDFDNLPENARPKTSDVDLNLSLQLMKSDQVAVPSSQNRLIFESLPQEFNTQLHPNEDLDQHLQDSDLDIGLNIGNSKAKNKRKTH